MLKKIFAALAVMIFIFSATTSTTFAKTEIKDNVITVTGYGTVPKSANSNGSFYRSFARQAAKLDALCQLVESVIKPDFASETTVQNLIVSDKVQSNTTFDEKFWNKHFSKIEIVGVKFIDNGSGCKITMRGTLK